MDLYHLITPSIFIHFFVKLSYYTSDKCLCVASLTSVWCYWKVEPSLRSGVLWRSLGYIFGPGLLSFLPMSKIRVLPCAIMMMCYHDDVLSWCAALLWVQRHRASTMWTGCSKTVNQNQPLIISCCSNGNRYLNLQHLLGVQPN